MEVVRRVTKIFLPAANLHGHDLQVLVKMYTTDRKFYKDSLGKLTYFVVENFYNHFLFLFFNLQLQVIIIKQFSGKTWRGHRIRRDLVTFWLIMGALTQPGCNEIPCGPKIFKANQIVSFFYIKFKHHDQHQNQHHDWNLLNRFWLVIAFGVLFKVSLKVKLVSFLKFKK